jgi:hypothetical protein
MLFPRPALHIISGSFLNWGEYAVEKGFSPTVSEASVLKFGRTSSFQKWQSGQALPYINFIFRKTKYRSTNRLLRGISWRYLTNS